MANWRGGGKYPFPKKASHRNETSRYGITDASRIRLRTVLIRPQESDRFSVIRWGGTTRISTRRAGVAAIRAMSGKLSIAQVKEKLAAQYRKNAAAVDLSALLVSLAAACPIDSIAGRAV